MGRKKTPTKILEARNAFRKHPERRRDGEPVVTDPIGAPPDSLTQLEVESWQELVTAAPLGVLTAADRVTVEMAACLLAEYRLDRAGFPSTKLARLQSLTASFGLNPADRARLSIEKPKLENPFAALG